MESISSHITNYFIHNVDLTSTDLCVETKVDFFKSMSAIGETGAINFTNLSYEALVTMLETNGKLFRDYFQYGFYKFLSNENQMLLFSRFKIPASYMSDTLEAILEFESYVKQEIVKLGHFGHCHWKEQNNNYRKRIRVLIKGCARFR